MGRAQGGAGAWQGEQGRSGSKARGRQAAAGWRLGVHPWARAGDRATEVRGQRRALSGAMLGPAAPTPLPVTCAWACTLARVLLP